MNRNISAREETAGGITVAYMQREVIVRSGTAIVRHIKREGDFRLADPGRAGDVRHVSAESERRDFHRME